MKLNNPKIKDIINEKDMNGAVETATNAYFQTDKNGNEMYTPYFSIIGETIAIANYFIEGIEFEKNEDIYESVSNDATMNSILFQFRSTDTYTAFLEYVKDVVDYKKNIRIAKIQDETNSILSYKILELVEKEHEKTKKELETYQNINKWISEQREQQEKLNSVVTPEMQKNFIENFDVNNMTEAIYKMVSEGDLHKKNREIIKANRKIKEQNDKIIEMQNEFAIQKQKENVKNVLSNKPQK